MQRNQRETRRQICAKYTAGRGMGKGREEKKLKKFGLFFFFLAFFSRHCQWQNVRNAFDNFIQFQTYFSKLFGCQRGGEPCPARLWVPSSESSSLLFSSLLYFSLPSPRRVPFPFFAVPLPATGIEIFTVLLPQFAYARQTFATGSCTITTQAATTTTAIQLSNFRIFKIHSKRYAASSLVEPRRRPCHRIRCNIKVI